MIRNCCYGVLHFLKSLLLYWYVIDFFYFSPHLFEFKEVELPYKRTNCIYDIQHVHSGDLVTLGVGMEVGLFYFGVVWFLAPTMSSSVKILALLFKVSLVLPCSRIFSERSSVVY